MAESILKEEPYTVLVLCPCCKGNGTIKTGEGHPVACPCCRNHPGQHEEKRPHPSHQMTEWRSEIRCPGSTPRFYGVRECIKCGQEEMSHPAGHFMERLQFKCPGG